MKVQQLEQLQERQTFEERLSLLKETAEKFAERAQKYDEAGEFVYENIADLQAIGYPAITVPKQYGGLDLSLVEMLKFQETIASFDGSTALSIGWHVGITKQLGESKQWPEKVYEDFCKQVIAEGALLNNAATEPATGSPTRGGRPETVAVETENGWILNGRKSFTTLAPVLEYFVISASIEGTEKVGNFIVRRNNPGLSIDETWDSIAMKGTGSHDLILEDAKIDKDDFVQEVKRERTAQGWLLHIPAVYLGIAKASQQYATQFATSYSPNSIKGTISDFPSVRQRIGEMELLVFQSETLLYATAQKWDDATGEERQSLATELSAVKLLVVNQAIEIVDKAMRIVGARSLSAKCPLQRHYRDVRAGLHNPPMDDMTIMALAEQAIQSIK